MHRRGIEVTVCEQSSELAEIGAGVQMTPNAMNALKSPSAWKPRYARSRLSRRGQVLRSWRERPGDLPRPGARRLSERFGSPLCSFHRADLLSVLAAPLPDGMVRLGARCVAVETGGRDLPAVARFADGSEVEADIVVGADGIHSVVRQQLFGANSPRFTGCMCWRGLMPAERIQKGLIEPASSELDGAGWACRSLLCRARRDGELRRDPRYRPSGPRNRGFAKPAATS